MLVIFSGFNPLWLIKLVAVLMILTFGYLFYNLYKAKQLFVRLDTQLDETQDADEISS